MPRYVVRSAGLSSSTRPNAPEAAAAAAEDKSAARWHDGMGQVAHVVEAALGRRRRPRGCKADGIVVRT